jgi:hypothetical protein
MQPGTVIVSITERPNESHPFVMAAGQAFVVQTGRRRQFLVGVEQIAACTTLTCNRSKFWRDRFDAAVNENEALRQQLRANGITPITSRISPETP